MVKQYKKMETDIGPLTLCANDKGMTHVFFGWKEGQEEEQNFFLTKAALEIEEYLKGERKHFTLPLFPKGTPFQERVWDALREIPYGETRTYSDIAKRIGKPKAYRAIGMANHRNPLSILIPCHRVIGADGSLVGYGGGTAIKEYLLELEKGN